MGSAGQELRWDWSGISADFPLFLVVSTRITQENLIARLAGVEGPGWLVSHAWHLGRDGRRLASAGTVDRSIGSRPLQHGSLSTVGLFTWWLALPTEQTSQENCRLPWKPQQITNALFCLAEAVPRSSRCKGKRTKSLQPCLHVPRLKRSTRKLKP